MSGVQLMNYLKSIQSSSISTIEILPQTGTEYDADSSGGVIRINLKRSRIDGTNGAAGINITGGEYKQWFNPFVSVGVHSGKLTLNFNGSLNGSPSDRHTSYQESEILLSQMIPDFKPTEQLDTYFQTMAKERGMEIIPLETAEYQASVLYGTTPIVVQAESLMETVDDPEHTVEVTKELNASYMARNLDNLYKLSQTDNDHPEFMIALLDRRNADWLTKLPEIMAKAPTFVAVGALHLAGEKGLIEGLRRQGYTVTPIK